MACPKEKRPSGRISSDKTVGEGLLPSLKFCKAKFTVILSEQSESKDLRTDLNIYVITVPRSLDSTSFRSG